MRQIPLVQRCCVCHCQEGDEDEGHLVSESRDAGEKDQRVSDRASDGQEEIDDSKSLVCILQGHFFKTS